MQTAKRASVKKEGSTKSNLPRSLRQRVSPAIALRRECRDESPHRRISNMCETDRIDSAAPKAIDMLGTLKYRVDA